MIDLKRILFPTDFSECAEHASKYAIALAKSFHSKLYVIHVLDTRVYSHMEPFAANVWSIYDARNEIEQRLAQLIPEEDRKAVELETSIREGSPFLEIIRFAKEAEIDLLVIGTHGRTGLQHVLLGSVTEKVVRKAPCPVLTVRSPEHEFVMP